MNSLKIEKWSNDPGPNELLIPTAKYVPKENVFCSINKEKVWGKSKDPK